MFKRFLESITRLLRIPLPVPAAYRDAVEFALGVQMVLLLLSMFVLDGGRMLRTGLMLSGGWLVGAILIMARRPQMPKRFDLVYVKYGFFFNLPLAILLDLARGVLTPSGSLLRQ